MVEEFNTKRKVMNIRKILRSTLLTTALTATAVMGFAQDEELVENGSFEQTQGKIKKLGSIESATGWIMATGQSADLFAPSSKVTEILTPLNAYGTEEPYDGSNYAGIVAYSYNDKMPRSYLMSKLVKPLQKGKRYCVTFYVSLAESSKYSTNAIGASFSKKPYASTEKASIIADVDVTRGDNKILSGFYGWDKVCNTYLAKGGEKYITLGNFLNNNQIGEQKMRQPKYYRGQQIIAAYYYVDNVSVKPINDINECDCSISDKSNVVSELIFLKSVVVSDKMDDKEKIEAQGIFFGYGNADVTSSAVATLEFVSEEMKSNPNFKLEIQGHMDDTEVKNSSENTSLQGLDKARAEAVKNYLAEKLNLAGNRITTMGMSNSVKNTTDITDGDEQELIDAKNRRVTFVIHQ